MQQQQQGEKGWKPLSRAQCGASIGLGVCFLVMGVAAVLDTVVLIPFLAAGDAMANLVTGKWHQSADLAPALALVVFIGTMWIGFAFFVLLLVTTMTRHVSTGWWAQPAWNGVQRSSSRGSTTAHAD